MQNGNKMEKEPITLQGLEKLKEEVVFLKEKCLINGRKKKKKFSF